MDVTLTDLLTCPRCGPTYGLVLMPDEVVDRRVRSGVLGCANCRERYRVEEGVPDLRAGGAGGSAGEPAPVVELEASDREAAVRLAALLGLGEGGGTVLLAGPVAGQASELRQVVPDVSAVVVEPGVQAGDVSRLAVGDVLPLRGRSLRGVALSGPRVSLLEEGARLLSFGGHLVLDPAPEDAIERVEAAGLRLLLDDRGVVVAGRGA